MALAKMKILAGLAGLALASAAAGQSLGTDGLAFLEALKEGDNAKAVDYVEKSGSTVVNFRGLDGDAALHLAGRARSEKWIGYLLSRGADPNLGGRDGDTPLMIAASLGHMSAAARLLRDGAQLNLGNKQGVTPLIAAVQHRQLPMVRFLLQEGADPDQQDYVTGFSARDYARRDNRVPEMLKMMEGVTVSKEATN